MEVVSRDGGEDAVSNSARSLQSSLAAEQQQLTLAKALLLEPAVLCIDELSLGLAPVIVADLLKTVTKIRETGVSLVLVEQSLNVVAAMCELTIFLEKGAVQFEGPTADLLERDDIAHAVFLGDRTNGDHTGHKRNGGRRTPGRSSQLRGR